MLQLGGHPLLKSQKLGDFLIPSLFCHIKGGFSYSFIQSATKVLRPLSPNFHDVIYEQPLNCFFFHSTGRHFPSRLQGWKTSNDSTKSSKSQRLGNPGQRPLLGRSKFGKYLQVIQTGLWHFTTSSRQDRYVIAPLIFIQKYFLAQPNHRWFLDRFT